MSLSTDHLADVHVFGRFHGLGVPVLFSESLPGGLVLLRLSSLGLLLGLRGVSVGSCHGLHLRLLVVLHLQGALIHRNSVKNFRPDSHGHFVLDEEKSVEPMEALSAFLMA